eukprot:8554805-Ditylum_brightwellii.AAC.1
MQLPQNMTQLRLFSGVATFYCIMWPRQSHVLAPLINLTGKLRFVWTKQHQQAFDAMKFAIVMDALMVYPNYSLPFQVYTDTSNYQMGTMIEQN